MADTRTRADWLRDHLIRSGHMSESGVTRKARMRPCPTCPWDILVGLDDYRCALEAHVDPVPVNALGEALGTLTGRRSYTLRREGDGWVLDPREPRTIAARPAGTGHRADVVLEHACAHGPPPPQWRAATTFPETRPPVRADQAPPF